MAYWASDLFTGTSVAAAVTAITYHKPPTSVAQAGQIAHTRAVIGFASGVNPATNDLIEMAVLPAGHVLVDWALYNDDFGSAELENRVGFMTGTPGDATRLIATVGGELLATGSDVFEAAALTTPRSAAADFKAFATTAALATPAAVDRSIGVAWETAATTPTSGSIRYLILDIWYKAAN